MKAQHLPTEDLRKGDSSPRIAPPLPLRSLIADYESAAKLANLDLQPWQKIGARYMTALRDRGRGRPRNDEPAALWKYREVCIVVARQNGKTTMLLPRIVMGLLRDEQILHTAQNREIPRKTFLELVQVLSRTDLDYTIRRGNGQEEVRTPSGGRYKLVAPNSNVRGESADLVLIDEVREYADRDVMAAMLPTITARRNGQIVYVTTAGSESATVLNDIRRRGLEAMPGLAYVEWSAAPERDIDDVDGWAEANPGLGRVVTMEVLQHFRANSPETEFETEHLCRWVKTMRQPLVYPEAWGRAKGTLGTPKRPSLGINMDASGTRASAVLAWQEQDGRVHMTLVADVTGDPIDTDRLGVDLRALAMKHGAPAVGFDAWTDAELARYFKHARPVRGQEYANASANFANRVENGQLVWNDADAVTADLEWTARKFDAAHRAFMAVKAKEDRPTTASFAAIRAVWLASGPTPLLARVR